MSNVPGYNRGVPVWQLVALILVILASGIVAYIFYDDRVRTEDKQKIEQEKLQTRRDVLVDRIKDRDDLLDAMGVTSVDQIKFMLGRDPSQEASMSEAEKAALAADLEKLVEKRTQDRQDLIDSLGFVLTEQVDNGTGTMVPKKLESYIQPSRDAGEVEAKYKDTKLGGFIDELIRFDQAIAARKKHIEDGHKAVLALDNEIIKKRGEYYAKLNQWDVDEADAWAKREKARDQLRFDPLVWADEEAKLKTTLAGEQAINTKLLAIQRKQQNPLSPIDGEVVAYDWVTRRGTIDLGAADKVRAGYEFEVFGMRPGPDRPDKRVYHGRIKLIDVYPRTSLFAVTEINEDDPVTQGDRVVSNLYDDDRHKVFVIKGWFPPDGEFTKEAVAALIRRGGGIVKDELTLDTDYLILGRTGEVNLLDPGAGVPAVPPEKELTGLSPQARQKVIEGYEAYQAARHLYVPVLTLETFKRYMDRSGVQASR